MVQPPNVRKYYFGGPLSQSEINVAIYFGIDKYQDERRRQ